MERRDMTAAEKEGIRVGDPILYMRALLDTALEGRRADRRASTVPPVVPTPTERTVNRGVTPQGAAYVVYDD
jgi:hypothetical protein